MKLVAAQLLGIILIGTLQTLNASNDNTYDFGNAQIFLKITSKIYGGKNDERGAHPWQALILTKEPILRGPGYRMRLCGGVLVKENWVLTAANCISYLNKGGKTKVFFGVYNKTNRIEGGRTEHFIRRKVFHPCWDASEILTGFNLVLVELKTVEKDYQPVCLEEPSDNWSTIETGGSLPRCVATGYGKTDTGETAEVLQQVIFSTTSHAACQVAYGSYVTKNHICAYDVRKTNEDTCKGDMGGPLLCPSTQNKCKGFYLAGITLGGSSQCGVPKRPGIYTAIHPHLVWIKEVIDGIPAKKNHEIICPKVTAKIPNDEEFFIKAFDFKGEIKKS